MRKITLDEWNYNYFAKPRTKKSLYNYIKNGRIFPSPVKVGGIYEIERYAILIDAESMQNPSELMGRINEQKEKFREQRFTA